ncbi:TetR/AcrR family transcriptional regulator [Herbiconiux sp. CPCC 205763]|uniref:TetR/AcrR family transcriptional regulator n=1 Tax=Herbiconiux aconitum TaxID=2970913 RepID=A0ABT2GU09_9MICO|nr:TetR/AcrR family transcriptional regulator [Herbiconiux aconitum]MCS5719696.1 TetR/AcrR family transcriptional regulator [Herbiconiux aconitum]
MPSTPLGLRDRKRQETRARIERAAAELVLAHGLEGVTVDAISGAAEVSPRTFFNYFESKEDAIVGLRGLDETRETIDAHLARADEEQSDLVTSIVRLLFEVWGAALPDSGLRETRMEILRRNPELLERHLAQMGRMMQQLSEAVRTMADRTTTTDSRPLPDSPSWAEPVLALCGMAVRLTMKDWIAGGSTESPDVLESRTIALVREAIETLR